MEKGKGNWKERKKVRKWAKERESSLEDFGEIRWVLRREFRSENLLDSKKGNYRGHRWGRKRDHLVEIALDSKKETRWEYHVGSRLAN